MSPFKSRPFFDSFQILDVKKNHTVNTLNLACTNFIKYKIAKLNISLNLFTLKNIKSLVGENLTTDQYLLVYCKNTPVYCSMYTVLYYITNSLIIYNNTITNHMLGENELYSLDNAGCLSLSIL